MRGKRGEAWMGKGGEVERKRDERGEGARGKRTKREREKEGRSGKREKATTTTAVAAAVTTTTTTARLNANSFIDWNSKSSSFDSCTTFSLHTLPLSLSFPPIPPLAASVVEPRAIRIPVRTFAFLHLLSSPTTVSHFPPSVSLLRLFIKPRVTRTRGFYINGGGYVSEATEGGLVLSRWRIRPTPARRYPLPPSSPSSLTFCSGYAPCLISRSRTLDKYAQAY